MDWACMITNVVAGRLSLQAYMHCNAAFAVSKVRGAPFQNADRHPQHVGQLVLPVSLTTCAEAVHSVASPPPPPPPGAASISLVIPDIPLHLIHTTGGFLQAHVSCDALADRHVNSCCWWVI